MAFTAKDVQALREKTGVGMMDCKKALVETDGDIDKAIDILREKGLASAAKKASRVAAEGIVACYIDGNVGVLIELNCESDFVAKNPQFSEIANEVSKVIVKYSPANVEALLACETAENGSVEEYLKGKIAIIGEKIAVRRFEKYELSYTDIALVNKIPNKLIVLYLPKGIILFLITIIVLSI